MKITNSRAPGAWKQRPELAGGAISIADPKEDPAVGPQIAGSAFASAYAVMLTTSAGDEKRCVLNEPAHVFLPISKVQMTKDTPIVSY